MGLCVVDDPLVWIDVDMFHVGIVSLALVLVMPIVHALVQSSYVYPCSFLLVNQRKLS